SGTTVKSSLTPSPVRTCSPQPPSESAIEDRRKRQPSAAVDQADEKMAMVHVRPAIGSFFSKDPLITASARATENPAVLGSPASPCPIEQNRGAAQFEPRSLE